MVEEEKKEIDHVKDWFVHDSNSAIAHVKDYLIYALKKPEIKDEYIRIAIMKCEEALYLNTLLYTGTRRSKSCIEAVTKWVKYRDYPRVSVAGTNDLLIRSNDTTKVIMILSELSKNAYKAGAKNMRIVFKEDGIHISNDGKPIEMAEDKIFLKGFSTFGTTGLGLNICRNLASYSNLKLDLIYADPVTFRISKL